MSQKRVPSIKQVDDDALTQALLVVLAVSADSDDIQMLVEDEVFVFGGMLLLCPVPAGS